MKATINFETDNLIVEAFGFTETFNLQEEMIIQGWDDAWFVLGLEREDGEAYFELDFNLVWNEGEEPIMSVYPVIDGKKFFTKWERCELKVIGNRKEYEYVNKDIDRDIMNYYGRFITLRTPEFVEETIHLTDGGIRKVISRMTTKGDKIVLKPLEDVLKDTKMMDKLTIGEKEKLEMIINNNLTDVSIAKTLSSKIEETLKNNNYDVYRFINKGYAVKG
jgi:hypothetical protein